MPRLDTCLAAAKDFQGPNELGKTAKALAVRRIWLGKRGRPADPGGCVQPWAVSAFLQL